MKLIKCKEEKKKQKKVGQEPMVHPSGFSNRAWMENSKKKTTFFLKMGAKPERQESLDTTVTQLEDRFKPVHTKVNTVVFVFLEKNSLKNLNGKSR